MSEIKLSFIMPAFNEAKVIGETLAKIGELVPHELAHEILVIDNGSEDETVAIASSFGCVVASIPGVSVAALRNVGARCALGDVLIFIDADISLTREWSASIGKYFADAVICSRIYGSEFLPVGDEGILDKYWFRLFLRSRQKSYIGTGHMVVSRARFLELNGFDECLRTGEDYEFCQRALRRGFEMVITPDLAVVHRGYPKSVLQFLRREAWHGVGDLVSLRAFLNSKVAVTASIFAFTSALSLALAVSGEVIVALSLLGLSATLVVAVSVVKFPRLTLWERIVNSYLVGVYLTGRALSPAWKRRKWR